MSCKDPCVLKSEVNKHSTGGRTYSYYAQLNGCPMKDEITDTRYRLLAIGKTRKWNFAGKWKAQMSTKGVSCISFLILSLYPDDTDMS